ncbi:MAG: penicillin-binding protein activator LpoB [Calditrichaceae bacterium]|nr:penicillin-binding protein activator LpoB [Calditrichaceae bacterium]
MNIIRIFLVISLVAVILNCGGSSRKVTRLRVDENTDITGRWNDTDSRQTANAMVQDLLTKPWINNFISDNSRKPFVIIGDIRNKSSEHIPVATFVKDIEKELVNSGQVSFVASAREREGIRDERMDQQGYASSETVKELANEQAADYMLQGVISSIVESFEGQKVVYYQVNMELVDLESNTKVWLGDKKIKKAISQKKHDW